MPKRIIFIIFLLIVANLYSAERDVYKIKHKDKEDIVLEILPSTSYETVLKEAVNGENPEMLVEAMFRVKSESNKSTNELLDLLLQSSTLKGIEYFSRGENKIETLFHQAYSVGENGKPVPDLTNPDDLKHLKGEIFLEDNSFGDLNYIVDYYDSEDSCGMIMENNSSLKAMFLTLAKPGEVKLLYQVIPTEDGYLLYGAALSKVKVPFFLKEKFSQSLYNRLEAVINWFEEGLTKNS